jgi:hypothetical protein
MNANKQSRKVQVGLAALLGLGAVAVMTTSSNVDAQVTEVSPACSNANAVLSVATPESAATQWEGIKTFFNNKRVWTYDGYQPGLAGKVELREWEIATPVPGGGTVALTVHCGAGGTCNEIAKLWMAEHKDWKPVVQMWCGDFNAVLKDGSARNPG